MLGLTYYYLGGVLASLGREAESLLAYERAVDYQRVVFAKDTDDLRVRGFLAEHYHDLLVVQLKLGRKAEMTRSLKEAIELLEGSRSLSGAELYDLACFYSLKSALEAPNPADPLHSGRIQADACAEQAIELLRRAAQKISQVDTRTAHDSLLDPLRSRAEFQQFLMDTAFPQYPFGR
jgi:hypothetical protein